MSAQSHQYKNSGAATGCYSVDEAPHFDGEVPKMADGGNVASRCFTQAIEARLRAVTDRVGT